MGNRLHKYQETMADFLIDRLYVKDQLGAGLFADLGTGKSAATLRALKDLFDLGAVHKCLICAPLRVIYAVWPDEIKKWQPQLTWENLHRKTVYKSTAQIELINHDSIHKMVEYAGRYDCLVIDESSGFKTWSTRRMKAVRKLLPTIPKRIILTGTPTPQSLAELHAQIFILDGGQALGKNVTVFRARFMDQGGWKGRQWVLRKGTEKELFDLVAPLVMRVDAASNLDMPELLETDIWVTLPPEASVQYRKLKRDLALELEQGSLLVGHAAALYTKLRQVACGKIYYQDDGISERKSEVLHKEKLQALKDIQEELYGKSAIIFYQFTHDLKEILSVLHGEVGVITGETDVAECTRILDAWNAKKIRWLVSHCRCLSFGINAQKGGADMIWWGIPDSCEQYIQARGRIFRQGQESCQVRMHRILAKDTVEELQLMRLCGRIQGQDAFLDALKEHVRT